MTTLVFSLVIFAAFTHAFWNFFSKKVSGNFTIFWYGSVIANSCLFIYVLYLFFTSGINFASWYLIMISAIAHAFYYITMLYAYSKNDISSVYPITRGTGVVGTAILSYFLLEEVISAFAAFGIVAVCVGIVLISLSKTKNQKYNIKSYLFSILAGTFIFSYAVPDKVAVQTMNPMAYICVTDILALTPLAGIANKNGISESLKLVKKHLKETLIIGFGSIGTYIIILNAMRIDKRASYVFSAREFSIVFGSLLGFIFLKEKPTPFKIAGIAIITTGLIMIKIG